MKKNLLIFITFITLAANAQSNYALRYNGIDGNNQHVNIGTPLSTGSSYTKEAWAFAIGNTGNHNIISSNLSPFWISGTLLRAGQNGNYQIVSDVSSFPLNRWVHVAVTYDASTGIMKLYRDGNLVSTAAGVATYTGQPTYISSHQGTGSIFNGSIDEVRIWNIALTQEQLKKNMYKSPAATASGLVAYYKCNEGVGTVLTNEVSGGQNGTLQNGPLWVDSPVQAADNALNFDGVNDHVTLPKIVNADFTVEYWMKTTQTTGGGLQWYNGNGIVDAEVPGDTYDWGTSLLGNKLAFGIGQPDRTIISTTAVNTGSWVHVAASWKQSTGEMKLYINGIQEATQLGSTGLRTAPGQIVLGALQTNVNYYNGSIDELRIWNEVRTPAQVLANMNRELNPSDQTTLTASYNFNQGLPDGSNTGLTILPDMKSTNNGVLVNFALNGAASNFVAQNNSQLVVLPLQWLSFTVYEQDQKASLNWSTANEQNTSNFIIQHSSNGADWNNVATLPAAGNSSAIIHYKYAHTSPVNGLNYYRLLQTDVDGRISYSGIRSVKFMVAEPLLTVLNNPVSNAVLQVKLSRPANLSLFNSGGRLLWQKQATPGTMAIAINGYAKGIYLLKANNHIERIVVQ